jgi:hypothetical protein
MSSWATRADEALREYERRPAEIFHRHTEVLGRGFLHYVALDWSETNGPIVKDHDHILISSNTQAAFLLLVQRKMFSE